MCGLSYMVLIIQFLPYAGGDLGGKCWCTAPMKRSRQKIFIFCAPHPCKNLKNLLPCWCRRGKAKFKYRFPSANHYNKFFRTSQGQAENKIFLEGKQAGAEQNRVAFRVARTDISRLLAGLRIPEEMRKTALQRLLPI